MQNATPVIVDEVGHFAIYVDRGRGWDFAGTVPTGRGAQYQEARDRNYVEGVERAREVAARYTGEHLDILTELPEPTPAISGYTVLSAELDDMPVFPSETEARRWADDNGVGDALVLPVA